MKLTDANFLTLGAQAIDEAARVLREHNDEAERRDQPQIEADIMRMANLDYAAAWELLAPLQRRLEMRYDNQLDQRVERLFVELRDALENAREPEES